MRVLTCAFLLLNSTRVIWDFSSMLLVSALAALAACRDPEQLSSLVLTRSSIFPCFLIYFPSQSAVKPEPTWHWMRLDTLIVPFLSCCFFWKTCCMLQVSIGPRRLSQTCFVKWSLIIYPESAWVCPISLGFSLAVRPWVGCKETFSNFWSIIEATSISGKKRIWAGVTLRQQKLRFSN